MIFYSERILGDESAVGEVRRAGVDIGVIFYPVKYSCARVPLFRRNGNQSPPQNYLFILRDTAYLFSM